MCNKHESQYTAAIHNHMIPEYMDAALSTGKEEQISIIVPADLIHFKLELLLSTRLVCLHIDKRHKVFFVAYCDRVTIRRPTYIDVLS